MAVDMFLKIDGIKGESNVKGREGSIDILSFGWGAVNPVVMGDGSGSGAGKAQLQDFSFVKEPDLATAKLFKGVVTGEHYPEATLTLVKVGQIQQEFMKIKFSDIIVTSYQTGGSAGAVPAEQCSLSFSRVDLSTADQKADGSIGSWETIGWDVAKNASL